VQSELPKWVKSWPKVENWYPIPELCLSTGTLPFGSGWYIQRVIPQQAAQGAACCKISDERVMEASEITLARLRVQLDCLPILLAAVPENALDNRPIAGKWSAREHLAHLARYQEMFLSRMQCIRSEDRPLLARYRAEDDAEWPQWMSMPTSEILGSLRSLRTQLVNEADRLSTAEISRIGIHPKFGEMTLGLWLEFFLLHEAHHLLSVMQLVRQH
jgi:uncharacterized damage-inducible protein DinB